MLVVLVLSASILGFTALAVATDAGQAGPLNAGPHGFSEILYAFASQTGNNGSAFAGLTGNTPFYNVTGALAMLIGRFAMIIPILAIAGSLAAKRRVAPSPGTFPTTGAIFVVLLVGVVVIVGALNFFPALALGPIVEQLLLAAGRPSSHDEDPDDPRHRHAARAASSASSTLGGGKPGGEPPRSRAASSIPALLRAALPARVPQARPAARSPATRSCSWSSSRRSW